MHQNKLQVFGYNARQWHLIAINASGKNEADRFMREQESCMATLNPTYASFSVVLTDAVRNYCKSVGLQIIDHGHGHCVAKCKVSFA